jgi:uncharacterized protein YdhG (YjbR/CyaY superfamily)
MDTQTIDAYIAGFPPAIREMLEQLRATILAAAPGTEEAFSYQMPTFKLKGNLVHFAVQTKHIGFYPAPSGIEHFKAELAGYQTSKGAVQFPLDRPIPYDLVGRIVAFRVQENLAKAAKKGC